MADTLFARETEAVRKANKLNIAIGLIFLAVVFLIAPLLKGNDSLQCPLVWSDRTLSITLPDGAAYAIPYDEILDITLIEHPDYGVCSSGTEDDEYKYGIWENDTIGEYVLCNYKSFQAVMQVTTAQRIYWVGYESASTTAMICENFARELAKA